MACGPTKKTGTKRPRDERVARPLRRHRTLADKLFIVQEAMRTSTHAAAVKYKVPRTCVIDWIRKRQSLQKAASLKGLLPLSLVWGSLLLSGRGLVSLVLRPVPSDAAQGEAVHVPRH